MKSIVFARSVFLRLLLCSLLLLVGGCTKFGFAAHSNARLQLTSEKSRAEGSWTLDLAGFRADRNGFNIEFRTGNSVYSHWLSKDRAPELPSNLPKGGPIAFKITSEAGDLVFTGEVQGKKASGRYKFQPSQAFAAEAAKLFKRDLSDEDFLDMAMVNMTIAYIREVQNAGVEPDFESVLTLKRHGLDSKAIQEFAAIGFKKAGDITRLRNHGVTPGYAREARALNYGGTAEELIRLRSHGVTPDFLKGWKDAGIAPPAEEVIRLRNHGVQPEYGGAWKKAGFKFTSDELIRARNHGVPADFAAALASVGPQPSLDEAIRLRQFGVTADYYREIKTHQSAYTTDEIVRFRQFGIPADYIKTIAKSGGRFSAEEIVNLRNHGVPAEYIAALNVAGRPPLDAKAIIELRNRGVSAETARKLRE